MKISFLYSAITRRVTLSISLFFFLALMASCGQLKKEEKDGRMAHVVAVHDSVMPKMSRIGELITQLKPLADSTARGQSYQKALEDLKDANRSMMEWMQGFGERFDSAEILEGKALSPEKSAWLDDEIVKVETMADQVNNSIAQAENLLAEQPK